MRAFPLLLAVPLAGCAPPVEQAPAASRAPLARVLGPALSCIPLTQISNSEVRDDRTIDFRVTGGRTYRNTLPYPCPELGFEQRFAYSVSTSQLCSSDIITVLHTGGGLRGASCGLGEFVPVELAPRDRP